MALSYFKAKYFGGKYFASAFIAGITSAAARIIDYVVTFRRRRRH